MVLYVGAAISGRRPFSAFLSELIRPFLSVSWQLDSTASAVPAAATLLRILSVISKAVQVLAGTSKSSMMTVPFESQRQVQMSIDRSSCRLSVTITPENPCRRSSCRLAAHAPLALDGRSKASDAGASSTPAPSPHAASNSGVEEWWCQRRRQELAHERANHSAAA